MPRVAPIFDEGGRLDLPPSPKEGRIGTEAKPELPDSA
jgi:hypothetical protein